MTRHRPIAAIDIGTNSIHMVIARQLDGGTPEILGREKDPVRLGRGSTDMKQLESDAIDRAIETLGRFRQIADAQGAEVFAVATSAVREAENQADFLRRCGEEAGVPVSVVSGVEEARLIHLGALGAVPVAGRRHLVIDIGGGSTELVVGEHTPPTLARSIKLGHRWSRIPETMAVTGFQCESTAVPTKIPTSSEVSTRLVIIAKAMATAGGSKLNQP